MAEWLTHVLLAYACCTVLGWRVDWLEGPWIAVAMVGSFVPDLDRLFLLVSGDRITALTGLPFQWQALHTLSGIVLLSAIGTLLFDTPRDRRRAFLLLLCGSFSNLLLDLPQRYADGQLLTNAYLFPLPPWRLPTPGWYVSADRWVTVGAVGIAVLVFGLDRLRATHREATSADPGSLSGESGRTDD